MYLVPAFAATWSNSSSFHKILYRDYKPSYQTYISVYGGVGTQRAALTPYKGGSGWIVGGVSSSGLVSDLKTEFPYEVNQRNHAHGILNIKTNKATDVK